MKWVILITVVGIFFITPSYAQANIIITSDSNWKVSTHFENGWMLPTFDESFWPTTRAPTRGRCDYYPDPIFFAQPMWSFGALEKGEVYFRKKIILDDDILTAHLKAGFDDDGDVYINGTRILTERSGKTEKVPLEIDLKDELHKGENTIAVYAIDSFGGCQWAQIELNIEYDPATKLDVPLVKQTDTQWSEKTYDHAVENALTCGTTIGDCGCALSSLAMILQFHGVTYSPHGEHTTPDSLNTYFTQGGMCTEFGCASNGYVFGAVRWNAVNAYSAQAHKLFGSPKVQYMPSEKYDIEIVKKDIVAGNPVILKAPNASHWFVAYGYSDTDIMIRDPFFDRLTLGDPAYAGTSGLMQRFEQVHSDFSLIEVFSKSLKNVMIVDMFGRRSGVDSSGAIINEIPQSHIEYISQPNITKNDKDILWIVVQKPPSGVYFVTSGESFAYTSTTDAQERIFMSSSQKDGYEIQYKKDMESHLKEKTAMNTLSCPHG